MSGVISDTVEFVGDHPVISGVTFVASTLVVGGMSQTYLALPPTNALALGAVAGTGAVVAEAFWWESLIPSVGKFVVDNVTQPIADGADKVYQKITDAAPDAVGEFLGYGETAKFDENGYQISGQHQVDSEIERKAFWELVKDPKNPAKQRAFQDAIAQTHKPAPDGIKHTGETGKFT